MKRFLFVFLFAATGAYAQDQRPPFQNDSAHRQIFEKCAQEAGLERPSPNSRPTPPSDSQRQTLDACLKQNGITAPPGRGNGGPPPQR